MLQRRGDAREGVGEGGDQRAVAQIAHGAGRDAVDQLAPLGAIEHRRLAGLHHVLRPAHGGGRVDRHHLAGDQPVEQHAHRGELLLHARRPVFLLQRIHPGRHVEGSDRSEREAALFAPDEEASAGPGISPARVGVVDVGGEEFDVAPAGGVTLVGDERRHDMGFVRGDERTERNTAGSCSLMGSRCRSRQGCPGIARGPLGFVEVDDRPGGQFGFHRAGDRAAFGGESLEVDLRLRTISRTGRTIVPVERAALG